MDKRNLIFDIIIIAVYIVVATPAMTGIALHEWIGLGIFFFLFFHVLLHMDWVIATTRKAFAKPSWSTTGNYILDVLLVLVIGLVTVSGVLVSGDFLPTLGLYADGYYFWDPIHAFSAKLLLALLIVHIVVHWKWFVSFFKKKKDDEVE